MRHTKATRRAGRRASLAPAVSVRDAPAAGRNRGGAVVGIGASAGGLATFEAFFQAMKPDSGAAFVLVQHLDPTRESLTAELVANHTRMPVMQVERNTFPRPNHVYVMPPNKYLTIEHGELRLVPPEEPRGARMPIDRFFRSLAADRRERAVGIVLSGTGTDGALGVKEINGGGGMTMVQTPQTAEYDGMPRSAIATGCVDSVLPVGEMPAALVRYLHHAYANGEMVPKADRVRSADNLGPVLAVVRARAKLDFGCYKKGMLLRRILRRMSLRHLTRMADYAAVLRVDADELQALGQDLLIGVTRFFRDPPAWQVLEKVVARLVEEKEAGEPLRVWVPGCASGEAAYSIAMLFIERLEDARKSNRLQIFASDVDDPALEVARAGSYPESIAADVNPERLRRFFSKDEHVYRVSKSLRESVTFAHQNILTDAPFSRLDMVSCRNLLMYLESPVNEKILKLFHFALREAGTLFLGTAETIGNQTDLFEPISQKWRIYHRVGPTPKEKMTLPIGDEITRAPVPALVARDRPILGHIATLARQVLIDRFAPACVVIDRRGEILHFSGRTQDYLAQPSGAPTLNLFVQAHEGLRTPLRAAVQEAVREKRSVGATTSPMRIDGMLLRVKLSVEPLRTWNDTEGLLLVCFHDETPSPRPKRRPVVKPARGDGSRVRQLELELKTTREELHSTIAELETANEELKASNEEVMSANEELQSTNEELQTSKEEMQSLNEELSTANAQLHSKVEELERTNDDLDNLLASTNLATVFLDTRFHIRRFTPRATKLFNLIPSDVGRPLAHMVPNFNDPELLKDAGVVLEKLVPLRKEVQTRDGRWYMRETLPYRTRDKRIGGVVITFSDAAAHVLQDARLRAERIDDTVREGLVVLDRALRIMSVNRAFCEMFNTSPQEVEKRDFFALDAGRMDMPPLRAALEKVVESKKPIGGLEIRRALGRTTERVMLVRARPLETADADRQLILVDLEDVSERKRQGEALRESEARTVAILDAAADCIVTSDARGIVTSWNRAAERIFGYAAREVVGQNVKMLMPAPDRDEHEGYLARYLKSGVAHIIGQTGREIAGCRKDGTLVPLDIAVSEFHDGKGPAFVAIMRDITQRKHFEEDERRHQAELARVLRVSLVGELGAGLAHEVSQPLAAAVNTLEACATKIRGGKATRKSLLGLVGQAMQHSMWAAAIVRNVRELVRRRSPEMEEVDLRELIEIAARLVAVQLKQHHITLRLALGDAPLPVRVSRIELEQVMLNLLQNAAESIVQPKRKRREREIAVSASRTAGREAVEVAVRDTGVGIPESVLARLFEPFFTTKASGLGMGLAICRSIVEAHGGRMWVAPGEHRPGSTTMRFTIPLLQAPSRAGRVSARRPS